MLSDELARLERLQILAFRLPVQWAAATKGNTQLAEWLFGVALGVAGVGMAQAAVKLLDALPGVDVGPEKRALFQTLVFTKQAW